jgi:hypothetical protein
MPELDFPKKPYYELAVQKHLDDRKTRYDQSDFNAGEPGNGYGAPLPAEENIKPVFRKGARQSKKGGPRQTPTKKASKASLKATSGGQTAGPTDAS